MPSLERTLAGLAVAHLDRQGWYHRAIADLPPAPLGMLSCDVIRPGPDGLARLLLAEGPRRFQLLVGWRPSSRVAAVLKGRESSILGSIEEEGGHAVVYDALADDELLIDVLGIVTGGRERAGRVRRLSTLVSHASLVFDERLFMKLYRVLEEGERPEIEVLFRLDAAGFNALLAPIGRWREHGYDLALVREFLPSALEGRLLALTSLRDLLAHAAGPDGQGGISSSDVGDGVDAETATAGGDLASEMQRLGATTAALHGALVATFGSRSAEPGELAAAIDGAPGEERRRAAEQVGALAAGELGAAMRIHGDYHLRRVMRGETGWLVAGFGDDPLYSTARPEASLAPRVGSPVEDLADMCFSLHRVAEEALSNRPAAEAERASQLAAAWERRNREAFLSGYRAAPVTAPLLPPSGEVAGLLLGAFEAVRRRRYEATPADG